MIITYDSGKLHRLRLLDIHLSDSGSGDGDDIIIIEDLGARDGQEKINIPSIIVSIHCHQPFPLLNTYSYAPPSP